MVAVRGWSQGRWDIVLQALSLTMNDPCAPEIRYTSVYLQFAMLFVDGYGLDLAGPPKACCVRGQASGRWLDHSGAILGAEWLTDMLTAKRAVRSQAQLAKGP